MSFPEPADLLLDLTDLQARLTGGLDGTLSAHGISYTEYCVLRQLARDPRHQMRRTDLAQRIGITASGVTRLLRPMEKVGLVKTLASARDARVRAVALSAAGERLLAEAEITVRHFAEERLKPLRAAQRKTLAELIDTLR